MNQDSESDGYASARYLWETPYGTITEWRRAMIAAIPEAERCGACSGSGCDVILASNGGVGEVVRCWPCQGTGAQRHQRRVRRPRCDPHNEGGLA